MCHKTYSCLQVWQCEDQSNKGLAGILAWVNAKKPVKNKNSIVIE